MEHKIIEGHGGAGESGPIAEKERMELRRRCAGWRAGCTAASPTGARNAARGPGRLRATMRRNMRFDGVPFMPVTIRRAEDRPRLVVLADVSLSVRATARFTLHLVHGLQDLFTQVRSFAFVAERSRPPSCSPSTRVERALGLMFGGDVIDVDANSDYGTTFSEFRRALRARRSPAAPRCSYSATGGATATTRSWPRSRKSPGGSGRRSG